MSLSHKPTVLDAHFCTPRIAEGQTHGNLGKVYELLNDMDKAIDHFEQVKPLPPKIGVVTINDYLHIDSFVVVVILFICCCYDIVHLLLL